MIEWSALWVSVQLAGVTTFLLLIVATPLAWWLATSRHRGAVAIEALVALPLVLPPTVIGFYLLILMSPSATFGGWWVSLTGHQLTFSFTGLVVASMLYSLPFAVQPLHAAFKGVGQPLLAAGATLGASPGDRFINLVLPLSRRGYLNAGILTFAHTVGEFGVVLMIGGNIPGETRVVSVAIYEAVETLEYGSANALSGVLLLFSFTVLVAVYGLNRRSVVRVV